MRYPLHAWLILLSPGRIEHGLSQVTESGMVPVVPTLWQIELGVLRMWHRMIFRPETIGTCAEDSVRPGWRARALALRPIRFFGLVWERAIAPWDLSGMLSTPQRITRHLLGAHHDGDQFVYDLQILALHPGAMEALLEEATAVAEDRSPRSRWLKDLTVYADYHNHLVEAVQGAMSNRPLSPHALADPDITFTAWLQWCAEQPDSPAETIRAWRAGLFDLHTGLST